MSSQEHPDFFSGDHSIPLSPPVSSHDRLDAHPPRQRRRITRRVFWFTSLGLFLLLLNVWSTIFSTPQAFAATVHAPVVLKGAPSKPNRINPTAGTTSAASSYQPAAQGSAPTGTPQALTHTVPMAMKAGSLALQANKATQFLGSDGRLEVTIPANAITTQDLQQAGGELSFKVTQIAPSSGSNAGGSGHLSLGTYLFQLVDANGVLVTHGLRTPITVKYHYTRNEAALNLDHAYIVQNGSTTTTSSQICIDESKCCSCQHLWSAILSGGPTGSGTKHVGGDSTHQYA